MSIVEQIDFLILCKDTSIDRDTGMFSFFNLVEQINVHEIEPNHVIPCVLCLQCRLKQDFKIDEGHRLNARIELMKEDQSKAPIEVTTIDWQLTPEQLLSRKIRFRGRVEVPITQFGEQKLRCQIDDSEASMFIAINKIKQT